MVARAEDGRWLPGESGNPGGRPRSILRLSEIAKAHTETAIATLAEIMGDKDAPAPARITAACALLDRGYGRPLTDYAALVADRDLAPGLDPDRLTELDVARRIAYCLDRGVRALDAPAPVTLDADVSDGET